MSDEKNPPKAVYLFGAGASQACLDAVKSSSKTLMRHLTPKLIDRLHDHVRGDYGLAPFEGLLNNLDKRADFEHIISFLDATPSEVHRRLAEAVRRDFEVVLKAALNVGQRELHDHGTSLYASVLDMYNVEGCPEELAGIVTINYDNYIEDAAEMCGCTLDLCIDSDSLGRREGAIPLIKLHGSFGWEDAWPIERRNGEMPLWIPPGIHKDKEKYPFNLLWGRARELLNCDVLRIVGCRLAANDWDLISLLFGTKYGHRAAREKYRIEVVNSPETALSLQQDYPYLDIRSMVERSLFDVADRIVGELRRTEPRPYDPATDFEPIKELDRPNWMKTWIGQVARAFNTELGSVETERGCFAQVLEYDE